MHVLRHYFSLLLFFFFFFLPQPRPAGEARAKESRIRGAAVVRWEGERERGRGGRVRGRRCTQAPTFTRYDHEIRVRATLVKRAAEELRSRALCIVVRAARLSASPRRGGIRRRWGHPPECDHLRHRHLRNLGRPGCFIEKL